MNAAAVVLAGFNVILYSLIVPHGGLIAWGFAIAAAVIVYRARRYGTPKRKGRKS